MTQFPTRSRYVHGFQFGKATLTLSLQIATAVAHMCYCRLVNFNANHNHRLTHRYVTEVIGFLFDGITSLFARHSDFLSYRLKCQYPTHILKWYRRLSLLPPRQRNDLPCCHNCAHEAIVLRLWQIANLFSNFQNLQACGP